MFLLGLSKQRKFDEATMYQLVWALKLKRVFDSHSDHHTREVEERMKSWTLKSDPECFNRRAWTA